MHSAPTNVGTEVNTPMYPGGRRISSNPGSFRGSVRILQNACREEGPSHGYIMVYHHFLQRKLCKLLSMQPPRQVALSVPDSEGSDCNVAGVMNIEGTTSCTCGNIDPPVCLAV